MRIEYRILAKLPVVTESGERIGSVVDLELDGEAHAVAAYLVRQGMFAAPLRIAPSQVISITSERIVVKDAAAPAVFHEKLAARPPAKIEPVATSDRA